MWRSRPKGKGTFALYNLAVFISGGGSNLQALMDAEALGDISCGHIGLVIADRKSAGGIQRAEQKGIKTLIVPRKKQESLLPVLKAENIDFIVLSGYLSILPETVIAEFTGKIINIHPSLIPLFCGMGFYGLHVHEAVLSSGMKVTGATVHFADKGVDSGAIIAQRATVVKPDDTPETLRDRVLEIEHVLLVDVVKAWTEGRIANAENRAWIIE